MAGRVVYTGPIDAFFGFRLGTLEYRSVRFETELLDQPNFQGNAAVNYTDRETPWTRIIEHKWFTPASRTEAIYLDRYYAAPSPVTVQGEMLAAHDRDAYNRIVLFRLTDGEMRELDVDEAMGDCVLICEENSVLLPSPLTLSPDGKRIFAACTDPRDASRHAVLISTEDGTVTFLPGAPDDLSLVAFTEDGVIFRTRS